MRKLIKIINKVFKSFCFIYAFIFSFLVIYSYNALTNIEPKELEILKDEVKSQIFDSSNRLIEDYNQNEKTQVKYDELPKHLIQALISIEDRNFFNHDGIDFQSIYRSLLNNLTSSSRQGGSTLTQQVIKNLILNSEISLSRKIQEAYLALEFEKMHTKEEILELYFNRIYFEPTIPGIKYAAKRFFNKDVSLLNIQESALLVGLVKSPSQYSPFKYIDKANERKNIVLKAMYEEQYISQYEYQSLIKIHAKNFVIEKGENYKEKDFKFQSYLDVVYKEVKRITGHSVFDKPYKVYTYLDSSLQSHLDKIANGEIINFQDDITQISSCVIDNKTGGVISLIGGRFYDGMKLYNRAYDMNRQPASTLKPILTYALAFQYLNYNEYTLIKDEPYYYPNTSISVQNADKKYLGYISITDAIGYSRNTSTLYTIENVIKKIGIKKVEEYFSKIGLMDQGEFTLPYAIGGMKYGVSPINLASAYSLIPRGGEYIKPSVISKIEDLTTHKIIYDHENELKSKVLDKETCYLITSTLENVRNNNYLNINQAFPANIRCVGKTGTNAYDDNTIRAFNYPSNADKDSWFVGYSKNYTVASWTGFDEPKKESKTYFTYNDERRKYSKYQFKSIMANLELDNQKIMEMPSTMTKQDVVFIKDKMYLPNEYVPKNLIKTVSIKTSNLVYEVLPIPKLYKPKDESIISIDNELYIKLNQIESDDFEYIFGKLNYKVEYKDIMNNQYEKNFENNEFFLPIYEPFYEIKIYLTYKNSSQLISEPLIIDML